MIRIVRICADDYSAEASVERFTGQDKMPESFEVSILPEEFTYRVHDSGGQCTEKYKCLSRCADSEFFSVFIMLRQMMNRCSPLISGKTVADEIEDSRMNFSTENDEYSAVEFFKYKGEDYAAYILYDYSGNSPEFTFYLMQGRENRIIEEYHEYYELVESELFPVFAGLENRLNDWMEEHADE